MATLKLALDKRRKYKDGRNPLILRLTSYGNSTSIHLGIKILEKDWDDKKLRVLKTNSNHSFFNIHLKEVQAKYEKRLLEIQNEFPKLKLVELKKVLINENSSKELTFLDFALSQIENLRTNGRYGNAESYKTATNKLIDFADKNLLLSDINYQLILKFEESLFKSGVGINGVAAYMRAIRAIINKAAKTGDYDMSQYPFHNFKIRTQKTASRALSLQTINELNALNLTDNTKQVDARNMFLLIFSLIGISFIDLALLKKENIVNGRIVYRRRKTGKLYSVKLTDFAKSIFNIYAIDDNEFLLPQFNLEGLKEGEIIPTVKLKLKSINRYLKQLSKKLDLDTPLTTYYARYSWANIAKSLGFTKDVIAEALGHSYGNQVTGIYLEAYGNEIIDDANLKILSKLDY